MADLVFEHPPLAEMYDALEPDRPDLEPYVGLVAEFPSRPPECLCIHSAISASEGLSPAVVSTRNVGRSNVGTV